MKIDKEKVLALMDGRINEIDFHKAESSFDSYLEEIVKAFGDDEEDAIEFLESLPEEYMEWLDEFYEKLIEKFPSGQMEKFYEEKVYVN